MDMSYFWVRNQFKQGIITVKWYPGVENLGDYVTKHHPAVYYWRIRRFYVWTKETPKYLNQAIEPSFLRGCVKPLHHNLGITVQADR